MKTTILGMAMLACVLHGCSTSNGLQQVINGSSNSHPAYEEVPIATNFPTSTQKKLQAAEHWKRVANYSAIELTKSLNSNSNCGAALRCKTLYAQRTCSTKGCVSAPCDTVFGKIFHEEFVTALVSLGYKVSSVPVTDGITVEVDMNTVTFAANRPQYRFAGKSIEISDGVWVLKDVINLIDESGNNIKPNSGNEMNWFRTEFATGKTPSTELVITVSAMTPDKAFIGRNTEVYYIQDADKSFYQCNTSSVAPGETTQPSEAAQPCARCPVRTFDERTWQIKVEGDCTSGRCKSITDEAKCCAGLLR